jgi:hypothetical protein
MVSDEDLKDGIMYLPPAHVETKEQWLLKKSY